MKHKLLATLLLATTVIGTACEQQATASEYEQNVAALKAECRKLTEELGKSHESVVGKYLLTKSTIDVIRVQGEPSIYNFNMIFLVDGVEKKVVISFTDATRDYGAFKKEMRATVGEHYYEEQQDRSEMDIPQIQCFFYNGCASPSL